MQINLHILAFFFICIPLLLVWWFAKSTFFYPYQRRDPIAVIKSMVVMVAFFVGGLWLLTSPRDYDYRGQAAAEQSIAPAKLRPIVLDRIVVPAPKAPAAEPVAPLLPAEPANPEAVKPTTE